MRFWIPLYALASCLSAQTVGVTLSPIQPPAAPQPKVPATPVEDLCTIQGQVFNAVTGEPLRKASLHAQRTDISPGSASMPVTYSATSDVSGTFHFNGLDPGRYFLNVTRNGFISSSYGAKGPNRPGTMLSLSRGQHLTDVVFRLTPHGVVTGKVVDEDGDPVPFVRVQLMTHRYQQGKRQLMFTSSANTDDLGEYRISGVSPGKYFLSAAPNNNQFPTLNVAGRPIAPQAEEDYVPTYYPGTTDLAAAAPLEVTAGGQLRDISLRLSKAHTVHVRGHVAYGEAEHPYVNVFLNPQNMMGGGMPLRPAQADPKGDFDIGGVAPGTYYVTAQFNDGQKMRQARTQVDVGTSNVEGVTLAVRPGVEVTGRVKVEDGSTVDLSNVRFMVQPREPAAMMLGSPPAKIEDGRTFKLADVSAGLFNLVAMGLPSGYYVKSISSDQTDILANGLNTEVSPAPLEVVLSAGVAQVTGSVQNPATNAPAPGATIVLVPQEKERKDQLLYYKQAAADQNGAFAFNDIVPGEYKAYAWEDVEYGAFMDPDFMKPIESKGESLSLQERDRKSVQLTVIAGDSTGRY
jgi:hypothetical protein